MLARLARWLWPAVKDPPVRCSRCGAPLHGVRERIVALERELREARRLAWQRLVALDRLRAELARRGLPRL